MDRRETILDAVETILRAANTLAKEKVYVERTLPIDPEGDDKPPMINAYFPMLEWTREGGASSRYTEKSSFHLECWATISPGRASRVKGNVDKLQSQSISALTQQAVNALLNSSTFMALFSEPPNVSARFGMDRKGQFVVGCSLVTFEYLSKGQQPSTAVRTFEDLETIFTEHELRDSPGIPTVTPVISEHPDLQQINEDLAE